MTVSGQGQERQAVLGSVRSRSGGRRSPQEPAARRKPVRPLPLNVLRRVGPTRAGHIGLRAHVDKTDAGGARAMAMHAAGIGPTGCR
jgi:hypothetical protein